MAIAEPIYELVTSFPQDQAREILTFAESIRAKYLNGNQPSSKVAPVPWAELVYSLAASWTEGFPTLEDIRANSGQDILQ
ncbi:DUF2281 domain-containing protein [Microcoleus sp. S28C3]|uniref:DUF2281 domain-containing protein n=1 Tax=Microcoleus sp. S28C3 TaxID=3055414 RepID=UPI002FD5E4FB